MSSRPVLIALLLALLLAVGAYFVLKAPGGKPAPAFIVPTGAPILTLDPAAVTAFTLKTPAGSQVLDRHENGDWYWRNDPRSQQNYPLNPELMRNFLRYLTETKGVATPDESARLTASPAPISLTIHLRNNQAINLRLSPRALGGQVLTEILYPDAVTPKHALAPEALLTLLTNPGPSAWRDQALLPAGASNASRITFTDRTKTKGFTLAKRSGGGGWNLTDPIPAPANPDAIAKLLGTLDAIQIVKWFDTPPSPTPTSTGLDQPSAVLTLETDVRGFDTITNKPTSTTQKTEILIGNPADSTGTNLFASTDGGATIVSINAVPLGAFAADIAQLISRTASKALPADISSLEIKGLGGHTLTLSRQSIATGASSNGWTEQRDNEAPITQDPTRAAATEQLLANLTTTAADAIATTISPYAAPRATITLRGPTGDPLEEIEAFQAGPTIILRTGKVYRAYNKPSPELTRWLSTLK